MASNQVIFMKLITTPQICKNSGLKCCNSFWK